MSTLTVHKVTTIAALARLGIDAAEARRAAEKLDQVLAHFSAIQQVDTDGVPPADDVTGLANVTRRDVATPDVLCEQAALLAAAPATAEGHVKVRAVF